MNKAIVFSGGGSRGAYHVGAVSYLMKEAGQEYDILAGVSVGALVASLLAQYPKELSVESADELADIFMAIETPQVWKKWRPWGFLASVWKSSAMNSLPLRDLVRTHLTDRLLVTSGRELRVGAVNLRTGKYRTFNQNDSCIVQAVLASSAFPGAFEPVRIGDDLWIDGGVRSSTPLDAAIEAGADHVDVVICAPEDPEHFDVDAPTTLEVGFRTAQLMLDEVSDLKTAEMHNDLIRAGKARDGKREVSIRVIRPAEPLGGSVLRFDPAEAADMAAQGFADARNAFE